MKISLLYRELYGIVKSGVYLLSVSGHTRRAVKNRLFHADRPQAPQCAAPGQAANTTGKTALKVD